MDEEGQDKSSQEPLTPTEEREFVEAVRWLGAWLEAARALRAYFKEMFSRHSTKN